MTGKSPRGGGRSPGCEAGKLSGMDEQDGHDDVDAVHFRHCPTNERDARPHRESTASEQTGLHCRNRAQRGRMS